MQHFHTTIKPFYEKCYAKSDKTMNTYFWEEIYIKTTGNKLKNYRKV